MQQEAQNQGLDYTGWVLQSTLMKLKKILKFLVNWKMDGKNFEKTLNMKHFL